jgi:hypothetical protein
MKNILYSLVLCTSSGLIIGAQRPTTAHLEPEERCAQCDKNKNDPTGPMLASQAFNVVINGFIAAQSGDNKERQNQAVVNALTSISNIFQIAFRNTNHSPEEAEQLAYEILEILKDPATVRAIAGHLAARSGSFS